MTDHRRARRLHLFEATSGGGACLDSDAEAGIEPRGPDFYEDPPCPHCRKTYPIYDGVDCDQSCGGCGYSTTPSEVDRRREGPP